METISQREMRNNSGEILRRAAAGESFLVTNAGVPAARIVPPALSRLDQLEAEGLLTRGTGLDLSKLPPPVHSDVDTHAELAIDRDW